MLLKKLPKFGFLEKMAPLEISIKQKEMAKSGNFKKDEIMVVFSEASMDPNNVIIGMERV